MVLDVRPGGVVADRASAAPQRTDRSDRGSQALEFAMVLPLMGMLLVLFVHTGLLLADVVTAQGIARQVARSAAVDGDDVARDVGRRLAGSRAVRLRLERDAGLVEARVELRSDVFASVGARPWIPARATMQAESAMWSTP